MPEPRTERIREFYAQILGAGRLGALTRFVTPAYVSHAPQFAGSTALAPGIDALRTRLETLGPVAHRVARVIVDGELAFAHLCYGQDRPVAAVDVFHLDATGLVTEHWNVRQPLSREGAEAAQCFADSLPRDADFPFDREWVRARVARMLRELWAQGRAELVPDFYAESYVQHNPDMPGGFRRIQEVVENDIRRYIERTGGAFPITVHHIAAQDDLACVHLSLFMAGIERNEGARSTNVDIFRLDRQGRMIEHWDVLQIEGIALPPGAALF